MLVWTNDEALLRPFDESSRDNKLGDGVNVLRCRMCDATRARRYLQPNARALGVDRRRDNRPQEDQRDPGAVDQSRQLCHTDYDGYRTSRGHRSDWSFH